MKIRLLLIALLLLTISCSKEYNGRIPAHKELVSTKGVTKGADIQLESDFFVSERDILDYIAFKNSFNKDDGIKRNNPIIEPLFGRGTDLSSYLVNYENGWEILSADKRCQLVLAFSPEGNLSISELPAAAIDWLNDLNESICHTLDSYRKQGLPPTLDPIERTNVEFWQIIQNNRERIAESPIRSNLPPGHWELIRSDQYLIEENYGPLVPVKWGQGSPYNNYCPLYRWNDTDYRSAAGCVAVAGAQLLYYLHYFLGVPESAPSVGNVSGYVFIGDSLNGIYPGVYNQSFSQPSSTIWDKMESYRDSTAALIGSLGKTVNMLYGSESYAELWPLANHFYDSLGIAYTWSSYSYPSDSSSVIQSIVSGSPVLTGARNTQDSYGHAFLIDAYKQTRYCYEESYEYIFDNQDDMHSFPFPELLETVSYSAPIARYFAMNWGWEGECDNMWFAPLGIWNPRGMEFNGSRQMFRNFRISE